MKEKDALVRQLKDQLQELRTQTTAEVKYLKKETAMKLAIAQKDMGAKSKVGWGTGVGKRSGLCKGRYSII